MCRRVLVTVGGILAYHRRRVRVAVLARLTACDVPDRTLAPDGRLGGEDAVRRVATGSWSTLRVIASGSGARGTPEWCGEDQRLGDSHAGDGPDSGASDVDVVDPGPATSGDEWRPVVTPSGEGVNGAERAGPGTTAA